MPKQPSPSNFTTQKAALQAVIFLAIANFILTAVLLRVGIGLNIVPMQLAAGLTAAISVSSLIAFLIIRNGRLVLGVEIALVVLCLVLPFTSLFVKNFGWIVLVSVPLVVGIIARISLPSPFNRYTFFLSVVSGVGGFLLDLYGAPSRHAIPFSQFIIPAVTLTLLTLGITIIVRQINKFNLRTKLLVILLSVALIPLGVLIRINTEVSSQVLTKSAKEALSQAAQETGQQIDLFIQQNLSAIHTESQLAIFQTVLSLPSPERDHLLPDTEDILEVLVKREPVVRAYFLVDREGTLIRSFPPSAHTDTPFLGLPPEVVNGLRIFLLTEEPYVSPVLADKKGNPVLFFASSVTSKEGVPLGLLISQVDGAILQQMLESRNGTAGEGTYGVLFEENHIQLANGLAPETIFQPLVPLAPASLTRLQEAHRLPKQSELTPLNKPDLERLLRDSVNQPEFTYSGDGKEKREQQVSVYALESRPWKVAFFQSLDSILAPARQQTKLSILVGIVFAAIVTLASVGASRVVGAPITDLTELVERIAAGDFSLQVPVTTEDEIGRLGSAFNKLTSQIRHLLSGLEEQVAQRTRALERRALQLQTAAEVARDASTAQDLDTLLNNAVNLINTHFGFYHAGIFLVDEAREYAVMRAANSEGGKLLLARGHRLKVGEAGIVGDTTATGKPHIALDVGVDKVHIPQPLLPDTRSEMALPLVVGEEIIGALDVQSKRENAFDDEDITVLQVVADLLAIAIRNSRLFAELQETIYELETAYGEYTHRAWEDWATQSRTYGYRSIRGNILPLEQKPQPEATTEMGEEIKIPIRLRDTAIGEIHLQVEDSQSAEGLLGLVSDISERLALALENARLLESTQKRAARESKVTEITTRIRSTTDPQEMLKTALVELQQALRVHRAQVIIAPTETQLKTETTSKHDKQGAK